MAWISVHQQIRDHRKTRELFRTLKISRAEAIGTLVLIWTWAIDNCDQEGKLLCCTIEDISIAAYWNKEPEILYNALVTTRWIDVVDGQMYLHDWADFNKPFYDYITRKEKDKTRKREGKKDGVSTGNSTEIPQEFHDSPSPSPSPSPKQYKKKTFVEDSIEFQLSLLLKESILKNNPNAKTPTDLNKWALEIDRMIRLDNRTPEQIKEMIEFSQKDSFWMANILSAAALNKQFDKLYLKSKVQSDKPPVQQKSKRFNVRPEKEREWPEETPTKRTLEEEAKIAELLEKIKKE